MHDCCVVRYASTPHHSTAQQYALAACLSPVVPVVLASCEGAAWGSRMVKLCVFVRFLADFAANAIGPAVAVKVCTHSTCGGCELAVSLQSGLLGYDQSKGAETLCKLDSRRCVFTYVIVHSLSPTHTRSDRHGHTGWTRRLGCSLPATCKRLYRCCKHNVAQRGTVQLT